MNLDNYESDIRNKMLQHREVIDPDEVWQDLEPQLHPKKKRRFIPFLWLLSGIGIVLLLVGIWNSQKTKTALNTISEQEQSVAIHEDVNKVPSKETHSTEETSNLLINDQRTEQNQDKNNLNGIAYKNLNNEDRIDRSSQPSQSTNETNTTTLIHEVKYTRTFNSTTRQNSVLYSQELASYDGHENTKDNQNIASGKTTVDETYEPISQGLNTDNAHTVQHPVKSSQSPERENSALFSEAKNNIILISPISSLDMVRLNHRQDLPTLKLLKPLHKNRHWAISAQIGWGHFTSEYQTIEDEDEEYVATSNAYNKGISSQHAGIGLHYSIKNWTISSGIDYSRLVNRLALHNIVQIDTEIDGVQEVYYKRSGEIETVEGKVVAITYIDQNIQWHTYRNSIDIPLTLGYDKAIGRFSIGAQAGISFNISQQSSGAFLAENQKLVKFNSASSNNPYSQTYGTYPIYGLKLGYHLSPNITLTLSGQMRQYPTRKIKFDSMIQEKINAQNVGLNLLYKI